MRCLLHVLTVDDEVVVVDVKAKSVSYSEDREATTRTIHLELFDQTLIRDDVPCHEHIIEEGDVFRGWVKDNGEIDVLGRY